jgi:hypothetical protein
VIAMKDDGFESLRNELRCKTEAELIQFGTDLRKRFVAVQKQLELAKEEWLRRHPRRRR